jgi:VCBS repeat-containing protein
MKTRDIRLEIKIWGSILDCRVFLETDNEIGLWAYNASKKIFFKDLPSYQIDGMLETKMLCKGKNGASATLTIKIKGQDDETLKCIIQEGSSSESKSITIKENQIT